MALSASLLPEFDHEMAGTRKVLERVPEDRFDWRPHPKSYALGDLATHVATIPMWGSMTLDRDSLDLAPPGQPPMKTERARSREELLARFDQHVAATRKAIAEASDDALRASWSLLKGGQTIFTQPRLMVLRTFVMNHLIHHRAQLGVYLRLCDVPVPGLYGPSADEM